MGSTAECLLTTDLGNRDGIAVRHLQADGTSLIVLFNGAESWGNGGATAVTASEILDCHVAAPFHDAMRLAHDFVELGAAASECVTAEHAAEPEGSWARDTSFSLAAVVVTGSFARVLHCGLLEVAHLRHGGVLAATRAKRWVDEQVAAGSLSEPLAASHPLRHVFTSPQLGEDASRLTVEPPWELEVGDRFVMSEAGVFEAFEPGQLMLSAQEISDVQAQGNRYREAVVTIDVPTTPQNNRGAADAARARGC